MRTIIDLPATQLAALRELEHRKKLSRAELIRRAVAQYVRDNTPTDDAFGAWKSGNNVTVDALALQSELRDEWSRS